MPRHETQFEPSCHEFTGIRIRGEHKLSCPTRELGGCTRDGRGPAAGREVRVLHSAGDALRVGVARGLRWGSGGSLATLGQGLTLVHVRAQLEQLQDTFMS